MYIIEIIIDGFKSYATRTVVSGFDSQFNAITGLNGSGKSNVLDAICFVLGISKLEQASLPRRWPYAGAFMPTYMSMRCRGTRVARSLVGAFANALGVPEIQRHASILIRLLSLLTCRASLRR